MGREERLDELMSIISDSGYATVEYISRKTFMSPSTIRRDLADLERSGLIIRNYGGAEMKNGDMHIPVPINNRMSQNHLEKAKTAKKAVALIEDGTTIFIDASSTCLYMARYMSECHGVIVYTNGIILAQLLDEKGIETHIIGGRLVHRSGTLVGEEAIAEVSMINFDALFFSSNGYCDDVVTDYSEEETQLRRVLIRRSKKKYFLCDSSKFGVKRVYVVCTKNDIDMIVTDREETE